CVGVGMAAPRPAWRSATRFEQRGLRQGHGVWDFLYRHQAD
ncbi:tRNA (guanine-N-7) methyltransferase, partial [mine drainage metagenome]